MSELTKEQIREILGYEFRENEDYAFGSLKKDIFRFDDVPDSYCKASVRTGEITSCCSLVDMIYLGYPGEIDLHKYLKRGVDIWVDYFCGDWWKAQKKTARMMDKSIPNEDRGWYTAYSHGLFLALLAERWEDIDKVSQWLDWEMGFGYMGDDKIDYDFGVLYFSFANELRSTPMPGIEELTDVAKKFKRGPLLLLDAWNAVIAQDQAAFEKAFIKSLKQEARRKIDGGIFAALTPYHSVVAMAARRLGMTLPELEPKLDARIILPEKLGLK